MRGGKRRCIVQPIPRHQHLAARACVRLEPGDLVGGLELGAPVPDAGVVCDRFDDALAIPRKHSDFKALAFKSGDHLTGVAPYTIGEAEADRRVIVPPIPDLAPLSASFEPAPRGRAEAFGVLTGAPLEPLARSLFDLRETDTTSPRRRSAAATRHARRDDGLLRRGRLQRKHRVGDRFGVEQLRLADA